MPRPRPYEFGDIVETNCGNCFVKDYQDSRNITVVFIETLTEIITDSHTLKKGLVSDRMYPKVLNIGNIGYGPYSDKEHKEAYSCWRNMLQRCYDESCKSYPNYGGSGVTVSKDWHDFQNFAEWYYKNKVADSHLDKDLFGGKLYSEQTCVFLPCEINNLLIQSRKPVKKNKTGTFSCRIYHDGEVQNKTFETEEEALYWYKINKKHFLMKVSNDMLQQGKISSEVYTKILENT